MKRQFVMIMVLFFATGFIFNAKREAVSNVFAEQCAPTKPDMLGPFYEAGAPVRSTVGKGYKLSGVVRSTKDCSPLEHAKIEFWLAGPNGKYDDEHRATVFSDKAGNFEFESNFPPTYYGRPPHIHIRVSAKGFKTLITQHYPMKKDSEGIFDLVLVPDNQ